MIQKNRAIVSLVLVLVFMVGIFLLIRSRQIVTKNAGSEMGTFLKNTSRFEKTKPEAPIAHYADPFLADASIEEAGALSESQDPHWWVNSGGRLSTASGVAETLHGDLSFRDPWYASYLHGNPRDTDNGLHPQNIFRLVQTDTWDNFTQQMYFRIDALNLSESPNRNATNGLFLFNRYQTGDNLYYTGLRVDGAAVIKKKLHGTYYTMAYKSIFPGQTYDRATNPNLLPVGTWLGLKSQMVTNPDNSVTIRFYTDVGKTGKWTLALEADDNGAEFGKPAILQAGYAGIRTDFMDVSFSDYSIDKL